LLHFLFWCVYLSFLLYQVTYRQRFREETNWDHVAIFVTMQFVFTWLIAYLNYFYLLPRFLEKKNVWRYLAEFSIPFTLILALRVVLTRHLIDGYTYREMYFYSSLYIVQTVVVTLFIVIFIGMLRFAVDWFEFESRKKEVENEKLTAELNFLKAQINPHFLFNTLNNLYYLVYTKSDNATEVIAKLSQMMRYMIYDSNHPKVKLSKEIEYMQNYVDLERLRLNNEIPVRFEIAGSTDGVEIVPLIFITFLENAFKHGVSNNRPGSWVDIRIDLQGSTCIYTVENSKLDKNPNANGKSGIGLQNVQRRLELSYPGRHELVMRDLPDRYSVQLKIDLREDNLPDR
jgi:two-component system sensor histidine kinase AlgZ